MPTIDRVYWAYEHMFNSLDDVDKELTASQCKWPKNACIKQLREALMAMYMKLIQYFMKANHFVYSEAVLLDPSTPKPFLFGFKSYQQ
jgi:hypothetical protein